MHQVLHMCTQLHNQQRSTFTFKFYNAAGDNRNWYGIHVGLLLFLVALLTLIYSTPFLNAFLKTFCTIP